MKDFPLIALLTDFGPGSHYIAAMKGQILSVHPSARILDISHTVTPFNITEAAYILWSVCRSFPKGTIFIAVVDPGVGSNRKILLAESSRYQFLVPDNGILRFVMDTLPIIRMREVRNEAYFSKHVSPTFHGRDIFAPVAAHLSIGISPRKIGPLVKPQIRPKSSIFKLRKNPGSYNGEIIYIDAFGNIITNVILKNISPDISVKIGDRIIRSSYDTYAHAPETLPFFLVGSSQLLEISIRNGNAASALNAKIGQKVIIRVS